MTFQILITIDSLDDRSDLSLLPCPFPSLLVLYRVQSTRRTSSTTHHGHIAKPSSALSILLTVPSSRSYGPASSPARSRWALVGMEFSLSLSLPPFFLPRSLVFYPAARNGDDVTIFRCTALKNVLSFRAEAAAERQLQ